MDVLINLIVVFTSQYICILNHVVHIKYTQFLFVNYISVKTVGEIQPPPRMPQWVTMWETGAESHCQPSERQCSTYY